MNYRKARSVFRSRLLLTASCCAFGAALTSHADDQITPADASSSKAERRWLMSSDYMSEGPIPDRPDINTLKSIRIEWGTLERDALGNYCTIRGRLTVPGDKPGTRRPIDWFQGITVYLARAPGAAPDWSHGMDQKDTAWDDTEVWRGEQFEATFDLREIESDRATAEAFQFGVALAQHEILAPRTQRVTWDSETPAIASSIQNLTIPAAPKLSVELIAINAAAGWAARNPNGVGLIRAVNALQRVGKERALALLEEYLKLTDTPDERYNSDERDVVFWIVRLLFEPIRPDERIPFPHILVFPIANDPAQEPDWPLDPIALVDDIPFMVGSQSGGFSGIPTPPSEHIRWARRYGVIRDQELKPTTNPLLAVDALFKSKRFRQLLPDPGFTRTVTIRAQALAMLEGILPPFSSRFLFGAEQETEWQKRLQTAAKLKIEWDAKTERFVVRE